MPTTRQKSLLELSLQSLAGNTNDQVKEALEINEMTGQVNVDVVNTGDGIVITNSTSGSAGGLYIVDDVPVEQFAIEYLPNNDEINIRTNSNENSTIVSADVHLQGSGNTHVLKVTQGSDEYYRADAVNGKNEFKMPVSIYSPDTQALSITGGLSGIPAVSIRVDESSAEGLHIINSLGNKVYELNTAGDQSPRFLINDHTGANKINLGSTLASFGVPINTIYDIDIDTGNPSDLDALHLTSTAGGEMGIKFSDDVDGDTQGIKKATNGDLVFTDYRSPSLDYLRVSTAAVNFERPVAINFNASDLDTSTASFQVNADGPCVMRLNNVTPNNSPTNWYSSFAFANAGVDKYLLTVFDIAGSSFFTISDAGGYERISVNPASTALLDTDGDGIIEGTTSYTIINSANEVKSTTIKTVYQNAFVVTASNTAADEKITMNVPLTIDYDSPSISGASLQVNADGNARIRLNNILPDDTNDNIISGFAFANNNNDMFEIYVGNISGDNYFGVYSYTNDRDAFTIDEVNETITVEETKIDIKASDVTIIGETNNLVSILDGNNLMFKFSDGITGDLAATNPEECVWGIDVFTKNTSGNTQNQFRIFDNYVTQCYFSVRKGGHVIVGEIADQIIDSGDALQVTGTAKVQSNLTVGDGSGSGVGGITINRDASPYIQWKEAGVTKSFTTCISGETQILNASASGFANLRAEDIRGARITTNASDYWTLGGYATSSGTQTGEVYISIGGVVFAIPARIV
jgi:hypothetical protein